MSNNNNGLLLLAAGASSRMGSPKQLLPIEGKPLLIHLLEEIFKTDYRLAVIVVGAHADAIQNTLNERAIDIIKNSNWQSGIGSSISCGVNYLLKKVSKLETICVLTTDQFFVNSLHLMNLSQQFDRSYKQGKTIVASEYNKMAGVPAIFHQSEFEKLRHLKEDIGARKIIIQAQSENKVATIPFPDGKYDIDTPEDYQHLLTIIEKRRN